MRLVDRAETIGYGKRYPEFWLNSRPHVSAAQDPGAHVCLRATSETAVRDFHAQALQHGGANEGRPGPRPAAMTTCSGAFFTDPDGNTLEAVTFPSPPAVPDPA